MNEVVVIGRLTKDPELKSTQSGRSVCQFTVAVNRTYTNANGEREADFISCVVWDKLAENLCRYQKKGSQIAVNGRLQTRSYDNNSGKKVYVTEVYVSNVTFLDYKKDNSNFDNLEEPPLKEGSHKVEEIDSIPYENDPFEQQELDFSLPFD